MLDLPGVIVTDRNAASWPTWKSPDEGLAALEHTDVFAEYWTSRDHAQRMCAEVLVPDKVEPRFITRVYVPSDDARQAVAGICGALPIQAHKGLFFLR